MHDRRGWRRLALATALLLAPATTFAFPQSTDTLGEIPTNLNGVWLVVQQIEFPRPSPAPSPAPGASPSESGAKSSGAPAAAASAAAAPVGPRIYPVANLYKIQHLRKAEADKVREADAKMEQASADRAKAIVEEQRGKSLPTQTESGEVEGPKVIVPSIPRRPDDPTGKYDDVEIQLLDVTLPKTIEDAVGSAQKSEKPWEPSAKDLALLKSSLSSLKPSTLDQYSRIEWKIYAPEFMDEGLKQDEKTRGSKFVISGDQKMIPKPNIADRNIVIYGVRDVKEGQEIAGDHVRAIMASSPFPIPIDMKGRFRMYRIADLPKDAAAKPATAKPTTPKPATPAKPTGKKGSK